MFNYNLFIKKLSKSKIYSSSFIKNEIAKRLLKRLDFIKINPKHILIEGYTDKDYLKQIYTRFPESQIYDNTNQEKLFDIVILNSTMHLTSNLSEKLDSYYDFLKEDGILLFSTFGNKSFHSLKKAFEAVDKHKHVNDMIDLLTWGNTLQSSQYKTPAIESDLITFTYENVNTLFDDIRALNEPLSDTSMHNGLTGKNKWLKFINEYNKNLKLEVEALYGYAVRGLEDNATPNVTQNRVSLDDLKKQIMEFKRSNNT